MIQEKSPATTKINLACVPGLNSGAKHGICVGVPRGGKPVKAMGEDPSEFAAILKDSEISWVNFRVPDFGQSAEGVLRDLGFSPSLHSTLTQQKDSGALSGYEDLDTELGLLLPAVRVVNLNVEVSPIIVAVRKGIVLTIHGADVQRFIRFSRYAEAFMRKIPHDALDVDKVTMLLNRVLNENNEVNFDGMRSIEEQGDVLAKMLLDPKTPRSQLGPEIYNIKHALISYLNTLWASMDVVNFLRYGDPEVITDSQRLLGRFAMMAEDISNQISIAEHMSEVLASGLEVLQSIYNNQLQILNNKLAYAVAWVTVIGTAFLVPNTIATVLSNPAFNLAPSDAPWYTVLIILSTVVSTLVSFWLVMRHGWLPRKLD